MIVIISFINSFEMTTMVPFPASEAPVTQILSWVAPSIAEIDGIISYGASTILPKEFVISRPENAYNNGPKSPTYWMILDNCALLGFASVDILFEKLYLILFLYKVFLVVSNNSCAYSSSSTFFLVGDRLVWTKNLLGSHTNIWLPLVMSNSLPGHLL